MTMAVSTELDGINMEFDLDLKEMILRYMKKHNLSKTAFAKRIGYDRSVISSYISGTYAAKNLKPLEERIIRFLESSGALTEGQAIDATNTVTSTIELSPTEDAKQILAVCQSCQEEQEIGIIIGRTGYGKSYTLGQYAKLNRVALIECDDSMATGDLVKAIERILGFRGKGSIWNRTCKIKEFFIDNPGYLLIIDEADKLITKETQKKLEIIRAIYDQSSVGIVIAGEEKLEYLIASFLQRFANRIGYSIKLQGLKKEDVYEYLKEYNFTPEALEIMVNRATNKRTGCFRLINRTLRRILKIADSNELITKEIVEEASEMMLL